jgi:predicted MFS family arabinose efflux permease
VRTGRIPSSLVEMPSPVSGLSARRLILVLAAGGFASTFSARAVEPMVTVIARDLREAPETIALLAATFALPYAFIQPILGPVSDALGKGRIMKTCLGVAVFALVGCAFAVDAGTLFGLRILGGLAAGGVIPAALALLGDHVPMAQRQVAISRFLVAVITGQLLGSSLAGIAAEHVGWRGVFGFSAVLLIAACAATIFGLPREATARPFNLGAALTNYRTLLANPRARLLFALVFVEAVPVFGLGPYLGPLFEARAVGSAREAGFALAGFAIGGLVYSLIVAWLLRVLGLRKMLALGGILSAGALLLVGAAGPWYLTGAAMLLLGTGFYMLHNSFQTQVTELTQQARASAVALHAFSFFCGQALGVVVVGFGLSIAGLSLTVLALAVLILGVGLSAAATLAKPGR